MKIHDKAGMVIADSHPEGSRIFDGMEIRDADLMGKEMEGISFDGARLTDCDFNGADLYGANFSDSICEGCDFSNADMRGCYVFRAKFIRCNFRAARLCLDEMQGGMNLAGVDFTGSRLRGADFCGATYDAQTIFPEGFDPEENGLTKAPETESETQA